ncbi:hypothetical protein BV898_07859 [Hypsibius exemplaris]|uniref:Uncharacterized protein n=1 Tax=Hypsibius exemplaris TaxID=2072580 RepID=A0A1W0WSA4_HYPEX|nr:hypothetical protein BV898_07859 [Hypsibius exemplaris]
MASMRISSSSDGVHRQQQQHYPGSSSPTQDRRMPSVPSVATVPVFRTETPPLRQPPFPLTVKTESSVPYCLPNAAAYDRSLGGAYNSSYGRGPASCAVTSTSSSEVQQVPTGVHSADLFDDNSFGEFGEFR